MAAANRKAPRLGDSQFAYADARNIVDEAHIYVGEIVQQKSDYEVEPATDVSGVIVLGVSTKEVDNTDDGETLDFISTAVHGMDNAGPITKANIGDTAYVQDAATVALSGNNECGRIVEVDSSYVYVDFDPGKIAK